MSYQHFSAPIGCFCKIVLSLVLAPAVSELSFSGLSDPVGAPTPEKLKVAGEVLQKRSVRGRRSPLCGRVICLEHDFYLNSVISDELWRDF